MKKMLAVLVALAATLALRAETEAVGGYTWTYQVMSDGTVIIGNHSQCAISPNPTGAITIPSVLGGKPVTSIGDLAFSGCSGLTNVTIPSGVTRIGYGAFSGCSGLRSVTTIPSIVTPDPRVLSARAARRRLRHVSAEWAFSGCSGLTNVTISSGVTSIGEGAFSGCSGLTNVTIPDNVTSIGDRAFNDCSGLTSVTLPCGVMSIGEGAFSGCSGLTYMTIPSSVSSIGDWTFSGCSGLTNVTIPDSVTSIGDWAFNDCSGLTSVTLPSGVMSIGEGAFSGCSSLTNMTIPVSVMQIGDMAFYGCKELNSIAVNADNPDPDLTNEKLLSEGGMTLIHEMNRAETNTFYSFIRCREKSGTVQMQIRTDRNGDSKDDDDKNPCRFDWDKHHGSVDVKEGRCYPLGSIIRMNDDGKTSARVMFEFGSHASLVASEGAEFVLKRSRGPKLTLVILKGRVDLKLPSELEEGRFRVKTPFCSCENLAGESWFNCCRADHSADRAFDNDKDDCFRRRDHIIVHCVTGSMALSCRSFKLPRLVAANQICITQVPSPMVDPRDSKGSSMSTTLATSIKGDAGDCQVLLDNEMLIKIKDYPEIKDKIKAEEMLEKAKAFDFLLSPQCVIEMSESCVMGSLSHFSIITVNDKGERENYIEFSNPRWEVRGEDF